MLIPYFGNSGNIISEHFTLKLGYVNYMKKHGYEL
jgi:hypothetical protein